MDYHRHAKINPLGPQRFYTVSNYRKEHPMFEWLRRLFGRSSFPRIATDKSPRWVYSRLRHEALSGGKPEIEISPDSPVWCAVMEMGYPSGTGTVVAFSDGATSFYGSDSCIVVGGEFHEHVLEANAKFMAAANQLLEHFVPRETCPVPVTWQTIFYVRTDAGIFGQQAASRDLAEDRHVLSPLYHAGFEVFKHMREVAHAQVKNEVREGIGQLDQAVSRKPNEASLYFERAELYAELEEFDKAVADHDKAVSLLPGAITLIARGCLYIRMGDFDSALADFERAIQVEPRNAMAYSNRGAAHSKRGDVDRAIADYALAIQYEPKYPNSYANRAYAYYKLGEYEKGLADCNHALSLRPDHADTYSNRGLCRAALGDKEGARADFNRALELAGTLSVIQEAVDGLRALDQKTTG